MFIVCLLMQYTLEIDPDSAERPTFKSERMGAGVMHPKDDLRVILRARRCHDNHVLRFPDMPGKTNPCQERWDHVSEITLTHTSHSAPPRHT